jgi:hypothetical protein
MMMKIRKKTTHITIPTIRWAEMKENNKAEGDEVRCISFRILSFGASALNIH